jgi:hypothetical protein
MTSDETELRLLIGRMDAKLDLLLTRHDKHEERIASLERWQSKIAGVLLAASAAISFAVQYILSG